MKSEIRRRKPERKVKEIEIDRLKTKEKIEINSTH